MRPSSGLTFGGRYQLSSRIAIGGMGEVWQATDLVIGRTVAIKILKDEYLGDPGFLERFRAEARHAALVNHEGIANVFDYGEEEGSAFLVMELVPGEALSAVLERERQLPTDRVLDIIAQTASALQAAHQAGLVHRDIKPGNLLITPDGRVKITDFGIARIADQVPLTATGQVMGTVQYLSPEQASGQAASPTTDIYSMGIVAYEALAGRRPFTGESQVAIAMAQINEQPPELPATVAEPVRNLVYSSIAKKPEDRPASAAHLARAAQALRRGDVAGAIAAVPGVQGQDPATMLLTTGVGAAGATQATRIMTSAGPPTASLPLEEEPVEEEKKRSPWFWPLIAIVSVLAIALIGLAIAFLIPSGDETEPSPTPTASETEEAPEPSETPTEPTTVTIQASDYTGLSLDEARAKLTALDWDLQVENRVGPAASSAEQVGTVQDISPIGNIQRGSTITLTLFGDVPAPVTPPAPTAPSTDTPEGEVGQTIRISWPGGYNGCPSGSPLSSWEFTSNGPITLGSPSPVSSGASSMDVTLDGEGQAGISYRAVCGAELQSTESSALTLNITAAPTDPEGDGE